MIGDFLYKLNMGSWWIPDSNEVAHATEEGVLAVQDVDFCIDVNGKDHHTCKFNLMTRNENRCLVIRRGQPFKLNLLLNRPYDSNRDVMSFIFYVADMKRRGPSNAASAAVPLLEKGSEVVGNWSVVYESQVDSHLMVVVTPAADCIVAAWKFEIDTKISMGPSLTYMHAQPIYVLFNPWCSNDSVYMPDENHREEYVLEDSGLMFRGVTIRSKPNPWYYGQYEADILDCSLYLVKEIGKVTGTERNDPIKTARGLSAAVNVNDEDNGVLIGNWGSKLSDYADGNHPLKWVGSLSILQQYYQERQPVKYAQCWVFAGVLTTVCRVLGIPCRPVSCYNAAHDSEGSLTIDVVYDDDGSVMKKYSGDSVWNFHVWNEVWMKRSDIGAKYSGWQVLDSTPQEQSENMFRCGPASLIAVREGELQRPYDAGFVFAQVNADKVYWKYSGKNKPLKLLKTDTTSIGQNITTKAVGMMKPEDITNTYKYPEGTKEERATMEIALRTSKHKFARYYLNETFKDVLFEFEFLDDIKIGQDFNVVLHIKNSSSINKHQVKGLLRVDTVTYTGVTGGEVKRYDFDLTLAPESEESVKMLVTFQDYYCNLVDQASFNISCLATVVENQFEYFNKDDFRVRNPDIKITIDGKPVLHREVNVTVTLENPLPIPLTKGNFYIQAPGLCKQLKIKLDKDVAPGALATASFKLTPPWIGRHQITAKFNSNEMHDVDGFLIFKVDLLESIGFSVHSIVEGAHGFLRN